MPIGIAFGRAFPRIGRQLLHAEGNAFFRGIVFQHLDGDFVADVQNFRRMRDAAVGNIGDVQQAVNAAQIDERAVFGQILDGAGEDGAFLQSSRA